MLNWISLRTSADQFDAEPGWIGSNGPVSAIGTSGGGMSITEIADTACPDRRWRTGASGSTISATDHRTQSRPNLSEVTNSGMATKEGVPTTQTVSTINLK